MSSSSPTLSCNTLRLIHAFAAFLWAGWIFPPTGFLASAQDGSFEQIQKNLDRVYKRASTQGATNVAVFGEYSKLWRDPQDRQALQEAGVDYLEHSNRIKAWIERTERYGRELIRLESALTYHGFVKVDRDHPATAFERDEVKVTLYWTQPPTPETAARLEKIRQAILGDAFRLSSGWLQEKLKYPGFFKWFDPTGEITLKHLDDLPVDAFSKAGGFSNASMPAPVAQALFARLLKALEGQSELSTSAIEELRALAKQASKQRKKITIGFYSHIRTLIQMSESALKAIPWDGSHDAEIFKIVETFGDRRWAVFILITALEEMGNRIQDQNDPNLRRNTYRLVSRTLERFPELKKYNLFMWILMRTLLEVQLGSHKLPNERSGKDGQLDAEFFETIEAFRDAISRDKSRIFTHSCASELAPKSFWKNLTGWFWFE